MIIETNAARSAGWLPVTVTRIVGKLLNGSVSVCGTARAVSGSHLDQRQRGTAARRPRSAGGLLPGLVHPIPVRRRPRRRRRLTSPRRYAHRN